jgi:iron complex outermembrane receptor protein
LQKQKLTISTSIIFSLFSFLSFSQVKDTTQVNKLDEVLVSAVRVTTQTPVSFSNLDKGNQI